MKEIELTHGYKAQVDDSDYEWLNQYNWYAKIMKNTVYARTNNYKHNSAYMHRLILGLTNPKIFTDHKDRNGLNNQRSNIRACNYSENAKNRKSKGRSQYLGVTFSRNVKHTNKKGETTYYPYSPKWRAQIIVNGKCLYLGLFDNEIDAAMAYDKEAYKHHKEFARLNILNMPMTLKTNN